MLENKIYGVVGLDFLTIQNGDVVDTYLIEINLRKGGTTHPYWTTKAALGESSTCPRSGEFILNSGETRLYHSNDNIIVKDVGKAMCETAYE